jgi:hypothetical protein
MLGTCLFVVRRPIQPAQPDADMNGWNYFRFVTFTKATRGRLVAGNASATRRPVALSAAAAAAAVVGGGRADGR